MDLLSGHILTFEETHLAGKRGENSSKPLKGATITVSEVYIS